MRLNIIGNGFDMYHGLPCSYYYFGCYLLQHDEEFYRELSDMYGFTYAIMTGYEDYEYGVQNIFWRCFEEKLGELDTTWMEGKLEDDLNLECPDPIDIETPEEVNAKKIKEYFQEWVSSTLDIEENYKIVKNHLRRKKLKWKDDDYFINYNYTHTLEKVYNIPSDRVFHIHGACGEDAELIVGHGNEEVITEYKDKLYEMENSPEYYGEQSFRNRCNEYRCELTILRNLRKDTESLIYDMERQLSYLDEVSEICIWGLSCGEVDMPYIERLNQLYPDASWSFSYYGDTERMDREKLARQLELTRVNYFQLNNPNSKNIEKLLVQENNIQTFEVI